MSAVESSSPVRKASTDASEALVDVPLPEDIFAEPWSLRKCVRYLGFFGPAAVVASLGIGAGETIMVTGLGAWSEYGLLWLLLLSVLVKGVFLTYLVGRYTAVTGQLIAGRLATLPGPRGWLPLLFVGADLVLLGMGLTVIAKPCGNLVVHLAGASLPDTLSTAGWENLITTVFLAAALGLSLCTGYRALEKQQIFICGLLIFGTLLATLLVRPDWGRLLTGAVGFGTLPPTPTWAPAAARNDYVLNLVTVFGFVGGGLFGYVAYGNWVALRGWGLNAHPDIERIRARADERPRVEHLPDDPEQAARMRSLLTPLRWDVGMGAATLLIVTFAFAAAGAVVLFPQQLSISGDAFNLLTKQAAIWEQIHPTLVPIYYVAVLAALWGTLATVPEGMASVLHSVLGAIRPEWQKLSQRRLQTGIVVWYLVMSTVWTWSGITFDLMTQLGALITLNLGGALLCLAAVYFNATLPPRYRPRPWVLVGGSLSVVVLSLAFIGNAVGFLRKLG